MNDWSRDGQGYVKVSPVIGWRTAPLNETSNVFLRMEFVVVDDPDHVSALHFRLTATQC